MLDASEHKPMDLHDLYLALSRFERDNKSNHNVERRWLASMVGPLKVIVEVLKMNGADSLAEEHRRSLKDFRLGEIEDAKAHLQRESDALDQEARKLQQPSTKAA
jgi:cell division protein FtsB